MRRACRRYSWFSLCYSSPTKNTTDSRPPAIMTAQNSVCNGMQHSSSSDSSCLCDLERVALHNAQVSTSSSASTDALRAAFNLPLMHSPHKASLPLHIQQLHAAQIYATPPSTPPISELYEITNPHFVASQQHRHNIYTCRSSSSNNSNPYYLPSHQENLYVETRCCPPQLLQQPSGGQASLLHFNHGTLVVPDSTTSNNELINASNSGQASHSQEIVPKLVNHTNPNTTVSLEEDESNYLRPKFHFSSPSGSGGGSGGPVCAATSNGGQHLAQQLCSTTIKPMLPPPRVNTHHPGAHQGIFTDLHL